MAGLLEAVSSFLVQGGLEIVMLLLLQIVVLWMVLVSWAMVGLADSVCRRYACGMPCPPESEEISAQEVTSYRPMCVHVIFRLRAGYF